VSAAEIARRAGRRRLLNAFYQPRRAAIFLADADADADAYDLDERDFWATVDEAITAYQRRFPDLMSASRCSTCASPPSQSRSSPHAGCWPTPSCDSTPYQAAGGWRSTMLRPNAIKAKLAAGDEVLGLFCSIADPTLVELIGCADFVILDSEHTLVDPQELEHLIRAAEAVALTAFVRVPEQASNAILRALDAGAMGVVVPHVRRRSDVDAATQAARYAPEGMRSLNGGRVPGFGRINLTEYVRSANEEIMLVAMIEDAPAGARGTAAGAVDMRRARRPVLRDPARARRPASMAHSRGHCIRARRGARDRRAGAALASVCAATHTPTTSSSARDASNPAAAVPASVEIRVRRHASPAGAGRRHRHGVRRPARRATAYLDQPGVP
jgi:hypothetical protein